LVYVAKGNSHMPHYLLTSKQMKKRGVLRARKRVEAECLTRALLLACTLGLAAALAPHSTYTVRSAITSIEDKRLRPRTVTAHAASTVPHPIHAYTRNMHAQTTGPGSARPGPAPPR